MVKNDYCQPSPKMDTGHQRVNFIAVIAGFEFKYCIFKELRESVYKPDPESTRRGFSR